MKVLILPHPSLTPEHLLSHLEIQLVEYLRPLVGDYVVELVLVLLVDGEFESALCLSLDVVQVGYYYLHGDPPGPLHELVELLSPFLAGLQLLEYPTHVQLYPLQTGVKVKL